MSARDFQQQILAADTRTDVHAELARNREARAKAGEDAERTLNTPSFSANDLAVFSRRVSKAVAAKEREAAGRQAKVELARERAFASLEVDDPAAIFAAADDLLRAMGKVDQDFVMEWAYWEPDEAAAWLRQAEEANRQQQETVSFLRQQAAEEAQRKQTDEALQAAGSAYGELEKNRDWEQVYPHFEGLVRQAPENFLDSLSQAPEKTLGAVFEAARELDRAERVAEFRNRFREETLGTSMDFQLSGEGIPEAEPEPDLERVRHALSRSDGAQRFKETLLADDLREREPSESDEDVAKFKAAILNAKVGPGDVE